GLRDDGIAREGRRGTAGRTATGRRMRTAGAPAPRGGPGGGATPAAPATSGMPRRRGPGITARSDGSRRRTPAGRGSRPPVTPAGWTRRGPAPTPGAGVPARNRGAGRARGGRRPGAARAAPGPRAGGGGGAAGAGGGRIAGVGEREDVRRGRGRRPGRRVGRALAPTLAMLVALVVLVALGFGGYKIYQHFQSPDYSGPGFGEVTVQVNPGDTAESLAPRPLPPRGRARQRSLRRPGEQRSRPPRPAP